MKNFKSVNFWWGIGALILAVILKVWLVSGGYVPFNADEAVVAIMARHILAGEHPVFFYGQAYMGSLDALFVAGVYWLFGRQVWAIRLVQGLLYLGVLATTAMLGKAAFNSWRIGVVATILLAIPTVNITLYTTVSLGGYGEALLLGNLTLLCTLRIAKSIQEENGPGVYKTWALLGFLAGLGLWAFGLTLIYSLPAMVYLVYWMFKKLRGSAAQSSGLNSRVLLAGTALLLGGLLGSAPWWVYALQNGFAQIVQELGGSAIAGVEKLPWLAQVGQHLFSLLLLGITVIFGLRPPWDVFWLALPLLPFVLIFWMAVLVYALGRLRQSNPERSAQGLLLLVALTLLAGFVFTSFGADPSGRYFLPLAVPLALFAASMILSLRERIGLWAFSLVGLVLVYNLWGTIQCAWRLPPGISTQFYAPSQVDQRYMDELIVFLRQNGETRGYTNYWVSYPLSFLSQEELIFVPRLPYHLDFRYTERDDRYPPYDTLVTQAGQTAYITTRFPELDERLRESFSELGVTWEEAQIGDYYVFYALSRPVRPAEIGLGTNTP